VRSKRASGILPEDQSEIPRKVSSAGKMHGSTLLPGCTGTLIWKYRANVLEIASLGAIIRLFLKPFGFFSDSLFGSLLVERLGFGIALNWFGLFLHYFVTNFDPLLGCQWAVVNG